MTAPDTQPQGDTRTLAQQIRACADAVTTAAFLDRRHVVAATLRDLADRAAETELRADRAENARDQVGEMLHAAQAERGRLRNALTVIQMIVEESATNDADLLRQAILEQLPPTVPAEDVQDGAERNAAGRAAALTGTSAREGATGPQEPAATPADDEQCAHCGKPRNGYGNYLGAKVCHTGTLLPQNEPTDCYRLLSVYGEPLGPRIATDPTQTVPGHPGKLAQRPAWLDKPKREITPEEIRTYRLDHCGTCRDAEFYGWSGTAAEQAHAAHLETVEVGHLTGTPCRCPKCTTPTEAAAAATDYRAQRRQQNPRTPPPACPDCGMPETNCCCG